ncbi:caspase family protein [Pelomyxa schiedti]|nr:caspase family protein [Pelomyxa schiedti]
MRTVWSAPGDGMFTQICPVSYFSSLLDDYSLGFAAIKTYKHMFRSAKSYQKWLFVTPTCPGEKLFDSVEFEGTRSVAIATGRSEYSGSVFNTKTAYVTVASYKKTPSLSFYNVNGPDSHNPKPYLTLVGRTEIAGDYSNHPLTATVDVRFRPDDNVVGMSVDDAWYYLQVRAPESAAINGLGSPVQADVRYNLSVSEGGNKSAVINSFDMNKRNLVLAGTFGVSQYDIETKTECRRLSHFLPQQCRIWTKFSHFCCVSCDSVLHFLDFRDRTSCVGTYPHTSAVSWFSFESSHTSLDCLSSVTSEGLYIWDMRQTRPEEITKSPFSCCEFQNTLFACHETGIHELNDPFESVPRDSPRPFPLVTTFSEHNPCFALLVGNSSYGNFHLQTPSNDVHDLKSRLEVFGGFKCDIATEVTLEQFDQELDKYVLRLTKSSSRAISLFYFSGHGYQDPSTSQWLEMLPPPMATAPSKNDHIDRSISLQYIVRNIESVASVKLSIVIVDCPREVLSSVKPVPTATSRLSFISPKTIILYACAPGAKPNEPEDLFMNSSLIRRLISVTDLHPTLGVIDAFKMIINPPVMEVTTSQPVNCSIWCNYMEFKRGSDWSTLMETSWFSVSCCLAKAFKKSWLAVPFQLPQFKYLEDAFDRVLHDLPAPRSHHLLTLLEGEKNKLDTVRNLQKQLPEWLQWCSIAFARRMWIFVTLRAISGIDSISICEVNHTGSTSGKHQPGRLVFENMSAVLSLDFDFLFRRDSDSIVFSKDKNIIFQELDALIASVVRVTTDPEDQRRLSTPGRISTPTANLLQSCMEYPNSPSPPTTSRAPSVRRLPPTPPKTSSPRYSLPIPQSSPTNLYSNSSFTLKHSMEGVCRGAGMPAQSPKESSKISKSTSEVLSTPPIIPPATGSSVVEVCEWLESIGLTEYIAAFKENAVNGLAFAVLKESDLTQLGVTKIGHKNQLQCAITQARATLPANTCPSPTVESTLRSPSTDNEASRIQELEAQLQRLQMETTARCLGGPELNYKCSAFIVGNSAYNQFSLNNTLNDAKCISEFLGNKCHFDVSYHTDVATLADFVNLLEEYKTKLKISKRTNKNASIFYFAGHGRQVKGHNFLLMTKEESAYTEPNFGKMKFQAPMLGDVLDGLKHHSELVIAILDACRESDSEDRDEFKTRGFGSSSQLAKEDFPSGCIVVYPTSPGKAALDACKIPTKRDHGFFTGCLLDVIEKAPPGKPFSDIIDETITLVQSLSGGSQTPWLSKSVGQRFALF